MLKKTLLKISLATVIALGSTNLVYAKPAPNSPIRQFVLDYKTPAKFKLLIALKYNPDNDFVSVNDSIFLLKQVVANDYSTREEKRIAHYKLAEIYYQIYYSNLNNSYSKYKKIAKNHLELALYLTDDRLSFNVFHLYNRIFQLEIPPKIVLDDVFYLAPIKLLYYFFYHGDLKHPEFQKNKKKASVILNKLIDMNYADAFEYKIQEQLDKMNVDGYNPVTDTDIFRYPDITTKGIKIFRELIGKDVALQSKYDRLTSKMKKINSLYIDKLEKKQEKTNSPIIKTLLKKWKDKYQKIDWNLFVLNKREKALKAKLLENAPTKENVKKARDELEIKTKLYLEKRKRILNTTGHDINDDNKYLQLMKKYNKDKSVFY